MNSKEFKKKFGEVAKMNGFKSAFSGWFKESAESIVVLELQKSSFSNSNYLNIKIFIQGAFERIYMPCKDLIKSSTGHITTQIRDKDILDFDNSMRDEDRNAKLEQLFIDFIVPFSEKALSKFGIIELAEKGRITLLPAVKLELKI